MLTLWQTALLRLSRLRLQDEIDEALRYYELSLFDVVPAINAELRRALDERWPDAGLLPRPMLLPGSWIGGDRDGNPFVTADALRRATTRQAETALGPPPRRSWRRCATSCRCPTGWSRRPPELYALAEAVAGRLAVPRRRALPAGAERHLRAAGRHGARRARPDARADAGRRAPALRRRPTSCAPTSTSSTRRCAATAPAPLADDRLLRLREAVEVFGFHLCGLDMRQNSAVHEEVVGELLAWAGVCDDYAALDEAARVELLAGELTMRRPLVRPDAELSDTARGELDVLLAAAEQVALLGPRTIPNYVISMCESVSDVLEVAVLLKEVGLLDPGRRGRAHLPGRHLAAVRDDRRPAGTPGRR